MCQGRVPVCPSHLGPIAPLQRREDLGMQGTSQPQRPMKGLAKEDEGARGEGTADRQGTLLFCPGGTPSPSAALVAGTTT